MPNRIKTIGCAVIVAGSLAGAGHGASLGLTTGTPVVEASFATFEFLDVAPEGDLTGFAIEIDSWDGIALSPGTELDIALTWTLGAPETTASGSFALYDPTSDLLIGDLVAIGFDLDRIELQFGSLDGDALASFGTSVLAVLEFDDALGADPFAAFSDGGL